MTDDALKRAYRLLTSGPLTTGQAPIQGRVAAAAPITADTLAALANADYAEADRDTHLAAVAESAQNADLLRALRALADDAVVLSADVLQETGRPSSNAARRQPTPVARPARWYALAASVAIVGVVGLVLKASVSVESVPADPISVAATVTTPSAASSEGATSGKIMMASFEGTTASASDGSNKPTIFVGDFDS